MDEGAGPEFQHQGSKPVDHDFLSPEEIQHARRELIEASLPHRVTGKKTPPLLSSSEHIKPTGAVDDASRKLSLETGIKMAEHTSEPSPDTDQLDGAADARTCARILHQRAD